MEIIPLGTGKCSNFGGASDKGVGVAEGLGLIEPEDLTDWWFRRLFVNPGTWDSGKGLARNLDPQAHYCAMRWAFTVINGKQGEILPGKNREEIRRAVFLVEVPNRFVFVQGSDTGPSAYTGRLIDLSPGACAMLGVDTDDLVSVSAII